MKLQTFILTSVAIITLTACTSVPKNNMQPIQQSLNQPTLETIKNLDTLPDTSLGNQAKLIKTDNNLCQIEFTGFYQIGKVVENWTFNKSQLLNASTTKYRYTTPIELAEHDATIDSSSAVSFDITQIETQANFEKLKKNFSQQSLNHCNN